MNVVGYARISKPPRSAMGASAETPPENGLSLAAQAFAIEEECRRKGWTLLRVESDTITTRKDWKSRPGLARAQAALEGGEAQVLMVAKLDRLIRSLTALVEMMEWLKQGDRLLVVIDLGLDMTTAHGRLVAHILGSIAEYEREMISIRTKEGLSMLPPEKRARLAHGKGGRWRKVTPTLEAELRRCVRGGCSLSEIARRLNAKGFKTQSGGTEWRNQTVASCLRRIGIDPSAYPRVAS